MPKKTIEYSNTIIYKLTCNDNSVKDIYVGHTTNFIQRKYAHKQNCSDLQNDDILYNTIRENCGWNNWNMEIVDTLNCANHYEATIKEKEFSVLLQATLNNPISCPDQKIKNTKTIFYCDECKVTLQNEQRFNVHNQTAKHLKNLAIRKKGDKNPQNPLVFLCERCTYTTSNKKDYAKHCLTSKHTCTAKNPQFFHENPQTISCTTEYPNEQIQSIPSNELNFQMGSDIKIMTNMFMEVMKQNTEFKELIVDQHNKLMELTASASSSTTQLINSNNTNNNTVINNKFNLNVFLNEKCKDAMNITDFVNSLQLQIKDLENTGEFGFAEGISRIFTRGLKELDVYKRPIHCSDLKREILHMKSDGLWEKTNGENHKLIKAIKQVANKNITMLAEWKKENPGCEKYNSRKNDTYLKMTIESMGPTEKKEEERDFGKIVRSIAKDTIIEKEGAMLL